MRATRGFVLPVVLVCSLLLASAVLTLQFSTSADYRQVSRLIWTVQAGALADAALLETSLALRGRAEGVASGGIDWLAGLLEKLDRARLAAAGTGAPVERLDVRVRDDVTSALPVTGQAAEAARQRVAVTGLRVVAGPFLALSGPRAGPLTYGEPAFGDTEKDLIAWDLSAPLTVELDAGTGGALELSRTFRRTAELRLTDTVPPAAEFALFSFAPPPGEEHALNDLQRGGKLTVVPGRRGRVHVRGPLVLLTGDAGPERPHLGGALPPVSPAFPDPQWTGWATVPGPRAVDHPQSSLSGPLAALLGATASRIARTQTGMSSRRPKTEKSHSVLEIAPFSFHVDVGPFDKTVQVERTGPLDLGELSMSLADGFDGTAPRYQTIDDDPIAYYPPSAYLHAPLPRGLQTFALLPRPVSLYRGLHVPGSPAGSPAPFEPGLTVAEEGDRVLVEPHRPGEANLVGLFGIAELRGRTFSVMPLLDVAKWLVRREIRKLGSLERKMARKIGEEKLARLALEAVGLAPEMTLLVRHFEAAAGASWPEVPADLDVNRLDVLMASSQALVAPYGFYRHLEGFWGSPSAPAGMGAARLEALRKPLLSWSADQALDAYLESGGSGLHRAEAALGEGPASPSEACREWLAREHQAWLLGLAPGTRVTAAGLIGDSVDPGLPALGARRPRRPGRPHGAVLPDALAASGIVEDLPALRRRYPRGLLPPQGRDWDEIPTRWYPDMASYLAAEGAGGVLELRGAVSIERMAYPGPGAVPATLHYRGRGVLLTHTDDPEAPATLDATLLPAPDSPGSELVLAHRVRRELLEAGELPALRLGPRIVGSVYSDTGVAPAGDSTLIEGNLVTGLLNKSAIPASGAEGASVTVRYRDSVGEAASGSRTPYWTVELGGEIGSEGPGT